MKKSTAKILANILSLVHIPVFLIIILGFLLPGWWSYVYFSILVITFFSWIILGYCPLTKWEFDLRKTYMTLPNYHYEYLHYWGYKLLRININPKLVRFWGLIFLGCSITIWVIFHAL